MNRFQILLTNSYLKLILFILFVLTTVGFFYFENSMILRISIILVGIISLWQINNLSEIIVLLVMYLSLNDLYNIHYWRGIPIAIIMIAVFALTIFLFFVQGKFYKFSEIIKKENYKVYLMVVGLATVEIFLAMGFWPVDPRTKSLVITIVFYLFTRIIYFSANSMLSLKRITGYAIITLVIFAIIIILSFQQTF